MILHGMALSRQDGRFSRHSDGAWRKRGGETKGGKEVVHVKARAVLTTRRRCFFELVPPIPFPFCVQEREIDQLVVADVCALKLPGVTPEKVAMAVQRRSKRADIRVAYELLLDSKKARHRKEGDVCLSVRGRWPIQHNTCLQCLCDRFTAWQRRPDVIGLNRTRPGQCRRDCRKRSTFFFLTPWLCFS